MTGRIVRLHVDKGFGFIRGEDGADRFFHCSALQDIAIDALDLDDAVTFDPAETEKGLRAENVAVAPVE